MVRSTSVLRSSPRKRYGMHTSANELADVACGRGRAVPHRSLPPCGGGTGRGVATNTEREACPARRLANNTKNRRRACSTPLLVPPPPKGRSRPSSTGYGGREPWGTHLRTSQNERVLR